MIRIFSVWAILFLLAASSQAGGDSNGNELSDGTIVSLGQTYPTNLHYEADIAFNGGKMSLKDIRADNFPATAATYEGEGAECSEPGTDRIPSKYSENIAVVLCKYPDETYLENVGEFGTCGKSLSSTRDRDYYLEMQNSTGGFLLSCSFTFTIATQCFDCQSEESGRSNHCESADRFDFLLSIPYHEDAKTIKIFEVGKDKKKKTVLSIGVSKFENSPQSFE